MKTVKTLVRQLHRVVVAGALAAISLSAVADGISVEPGVAEPLPGRDYSLRLDLSAHRLERYDVVTGKTDSVVIDAGCASGAVPGLWLLVPQSGANFDLLPVGATPAQARPVALSGTCATLRDAAAGGVVLVEAGQALPDAPRVLAAGEVN
ncbi:hypothetical protein [Tahibacter amnicola]|uniref:Uncharacterized protein n=1 Tax=Tahibacter amnicola TaxID=2976241 RepID=A0ABY6BGV7_9GAMM|nr:hypothetical protein [Tahibacter amnicola]UXI68994.1 hypothetical protein N4264_04895 [Tahibacter amnicola]